MAPNFLIAQLKPADYVNPFIGTGGHGHTFPGATVPFGMVQLSPDTRLEGWDGCGGYHYSDSYIYGFSHTHLSGTGIPDYGDILLMPFTGEEYWNNGYDGQPGYRSSFSHENEDAKPGYYRVKLLDDQINVELTAAVRAGMHSYQFKAGDEQKVMIDLAHRDKVLNSWITLVSDNEIEGYRQSISWATDQRVYFVAKFSKKIEKALFALDDELVNKEGTTQGNNVKAILNFGKADKDALIVKVGISAVSIENARKNLDASISDWDFNEIKNLANDSWNKELGKIEVKSTDADALAVFYTALYHTMISPNLYSDVDGSYLGRDFKNNHTDHDYYTVFSLWDTYRAFHPLMTIIDQKRTNDFIRTFLRQYSDVGLLPVWELSSNETWCMIGYHAIPVIADAYIKGIRDYDTEVAFKAMLASAHQDIFGLKYYKKIGFVPAESEHESVSKTLEYAYDDWCIAQVAKSIGAQDVADTFAIRAQGYRHLLDPQTGFMRARFNSSWYKPFDEREVNYNYTEANSWQYSFYVPHDMDNFIELHGGKEKFTLKLDALFSASEKTTGREQSDITGLIGQYAHGNEPSHHIAYLYNYVGKPWKTQEKVNNIYNNFYKNTPDGLIGNEDCGQMSAWAVFSALGFYPVCPGTDYYVIGKPEFEESIINLENGNKYTIKTENLSDKNIYIQSATLNGKPFSRSYLTHSEIMQGGSMILIMGKSKSEWGTNADDLPRTGISGKKVLQSPFIERSEQLFETSADVDIRSYDNAEIRYTLNGLTPDESSTLYTGPFQVTETTEVNYRAWKDGYLPSPSQKALFIKKPEGINLKLLSEYATQYAANGSNILADGIRGSEDFRLGGWQGYQGNNIEALVTISSEKDVDSIGIGFLQDINAWIFMPERVELWSFVEGKNYKLYKSINNDIPNNKWGTIIKEFIFDISGLTEKHLKIVAVNIKECPTNHKGAGNPAWIFSDEISVYYK